MSDIQQYHGGGLTPSRDGRLAARAISRNTLAAKVRVSAIDAETDVTVAKQENVTMATVTAMQAVTRVAQAQQQLEQLMPAVSARINFLADDHAIGMAELLADLRHRLRGE